MSQNKPLVVIVGPTASGKTSLAIDLAEKFGGEIICADSRSIYKGADIGTAKATSKDRARVPHWGLDLVSPGEYYSVADFKKYADKKILEIRKRGNTPFLVGGTGLYIDAVVFNYQFGKEVDAVKRTTLGKMSLEELHKYCIKHNVQLPENFKNKRYVIRAIEKKDSNVSKDSKPAENTIIVGITTDKFVLRSRIENRADQFFSDDVINEAKILGEKYGWDNEAMTSNIYPLVRLYLSNEISLSVAKEKFIVLDWRLAKRQITWLKRNQFIKWSDTEQINKYISKQLAKYV